MRWGESPFLLVAALLHLALPVAAAIAPAPDFGRLPFVHAAAQEIEIDVSALDQVDTEPPDDPSLPIGTPYAVARRSGEPRRSDRHWVPPHEPTAHPSAEPPPDATSHPDGVPIGPEPGPGDMDRPPSPGDMGGPPGGIPGLPGQNPIWRSTPGVLPDTGGGTAAPTKPPKREYDKGAATKAIQSGVRNKDKKLGMDLPAAGAIAAVLRNVARTADLPYECSGSFSVALSAQGRVTAVNLAGFSGGSSSSWQYVRSSALAQLKGRAFPMKSSFPKGASISVALRSQKKMPGGGTARKGATLSFDVTDIGAKPTRVWTLGYSATPVK